jgi:glutathione S-transferase
MTELIAEYFSPWSEKARWALDHHRIRYRFREYVPLVMEPWLRVRLRAPFGRVSVPALVQDGFVARDSFAIAREAERSGAGPALFPPLRAVEIVAWNERSERALEAGRARVVRRMAEVPGAKAEALPPFVPAPLRPVLGEATGMALAHLRKKYALHADLEASRSGLRAALEALRAELDGRRYLVDDRLTYADISMAVVLQMVRPVADTFIPLGPATREVWSDDELARSFEDVIAWRDRLYAEHRRAV